MTSGVRCLTQLSALLLTLISLTLAGEAQAQTATDIYLLNLEALADGRTELVRITDTPGYDNQPHFSREEDAVFFTRIRGSRANIMRYELESAETKVVLDSVESDYSPTLLPRQNALSVVRVEGDQRQRLWRVPLDGQEPSVIFENIEPVGYHAWAAPRIALLFVLGEPPTLQLAGPAGVPVPIAENIGRALVSVPGTTQVAYVDKGADPRRWVIKSYDYAIDASRMIAPVLPEREDFAVDGNGSLWMASGTEVHVWEPDRSSWRLVIDLAPFKLGAISRLAASASGRLLALVAAENP
ncbi:MAG: hypothetical protein AAGA23_03570 [Pseudomonadota bacterium]